MGQTYRVAYPRHNSRLTVGPPHFLNAPPDLMHHDRAGRCLPALGAAAGPALPQLVRRQCRAQEVSKRVRLATCWLEGFFKRNSPPL